MSRVTCQVVGTATALNSEGEAFWVAQDSDDHTLFDGVPILEPRKQQSIRFDTLFDEIEEGIETVVIT